MLPESHILRRRAGTTVITEADREEARRLADQARSEARPQPAAPPATRPESIRVTQPRFEDNPKFRKFVELAELRVPKAMTEIENCKHLASKERYDYLPEHAAKIIAALRQAVDEVETAFAEEGKRRPRKVFSVLDEA